MTDSEWDPDPTALRDGEVVDRIGHANRNIEALREGLDDDDVPTDLRAAIEARIDELEARCDAN